MTGVKRVVFMLDGCVHCEPLSSAWDHLPRYVLASDYDRDTQRLSDESHRNRVDLVDAVERSDRIKAERDTFKAECVNLNNILDQIRTERDALRAQVEAMRELLTGVCDYADDLLTDVNRAWSYCGSTGADEVHKDADYLAARAALQAKP